MTLTRVLQIQEQLWASLRNPSAALLELTGEVLLLCTPEGLEKGGVGV